MACPFFMPTEKLENGAWPHPSRLPLGCGWSGHCTVPGHEGELLQSQELHRCNLGYADGCHRMPQDRVWDSVRFAVRASTLRATDGVELLRRIELQYVCERKHRPVEHGTLEFDTVSQTWLRMHGDARVQRMAECFLQVNRERRNLRAGAAGSASAAN